MVPKSAPRSSLLPSMGDHGSGGEGGGVREAALPAFDRLHPSRFVVLSFPNPLYPSGSGAVSLRVAVLDSPAPPRTPAAAAAMLVPAGRESDWLFSTSAGHLQLLLSCSASRLVLLGDPPHGDALPPVYTRRQSPSTAQYEQAVLPLLLALSPRAAFEGGALPEVPFLSYEDGVVWSAVVEVAAGPVAGEMLVEDVELETVEAAAGRERRRRLRFKRMPNLVQTQVRLVRDVADSSVFRLDTGVLVHPYLAPMVAGLSLASSLIEKKTQLGLRPRVMCIGIGGGALLTFLESKLHFNVFGLEVDEVVLSAARRHFGLVESEFLKVVVEDGIRLFRSSCREDSTAKCCLGDVCCKHVRLRWWQEYIERGIDAIMVDLDSGDAKNGVMAPPADFLKKDVLLSIKSVLDVQGVLVMNVVLLNGCLYDELVGYLRDVFLDVYEIDVGNGENCVLLAPVSPVASSGDVNESAFVKKLRQTAGDKYVDAIRKI